MGVTDAGRGISPLGGRSALRRHGAALCFFLLALALRLYLGDSFGTHYPFLLFLFAVIASSGYGGLLPGLQTTVLSILAAAWLGEVIGAGATLPLDPRFGPRVLSFAALSLVISLFIDRLLRANERLRASSIALEESNARLKRSEEELKLANARLQQSETELTQANSLLTNSNDELETFAYAVSHDLQAPLRTVGTLCEVLAETNKGRLDAETDQLLNHIGNGVRRMSRLVSDLLDYSRATRFDPRRGPATDGNSVLHAVLRDHQAAIAEGGARIVATPLPALRINPRRFNQLLTNLIENALKYRSSAPPEVNIDNHVDGDRWILSVQDNGIGFDQQYAEKIFRPFERLHSTLEYEGSGIGLAIVKRIVDQEGGQVWAESEPGQGSTFFLSLPRTSLDPEPQKVPEPVSPVGAQ